MSATDISPEAVDNAAAYLEDTHPNTAAMLRSLRLSLTASDKDAARYRWLRAWWSRSQITSRLEWPSPPWVVRAEVSEGTPTMVGIHSGSLDAAIDAEMEKANG